MENQPKKLITRILEFAGLLALSAFLIRLAARYILEVWPVLAVMAALTAAAAVFWCVLKNKSWL